MTSAGFHPNSAAAELAVLADHAERARQRVADLVGPAARSGSCDDAVAAMYEAERALRTAYRQLDRATGLLRR